MGYDARAWGRCDHYHELLCAGGSAEFACGICIPWKNGIFVYIFDRFKDLSCRAGLLCVLQTLEFQTILYPAGKLHILLWKLCFIYRNHASVFPESDDLSSSFASWHWEDFWEKITGSFCIVCVSVGGQQFLFLLYAVNFYVYLCGFPICNDFS